MTLSVSHRDVFCRRLQESASASNQRKQSEKRRNVFVLCGAAVHPVCVHAAGLTEAPAETQLTGDQFYFCRRPSSLSVPMLNCTEGHAAAAAAAAAQQTHAQLQTSGNNSALNILLLSCFIIPIWKIQTTEKIYSSHNLNSSFNFYHFISSCDFFARLL